jgi:sulfur-oxidizing protein SoxX
MNLKNPLVVIALAATLVSSHVQAAGASDLKPAQLDKLTAQAVKTSFRDEALVKTSVIETDKTNTLCSAADVKGKPLDAKTRSAVENENFKAIKLPPDGKFIGDYKEGEKIAQSGRGLTFTDDAKTANGGNCYNCHQIDKKEISFGTIGPSLYNYGKLRGVSDVNSPDAKPMLLYTWGKIWNGKASNACSNMPRAGHQGILTAQQIADLMALLLDPRSPVNQ